MYTTSLTLVGGEGHKMWDRDLVARLSPSASQVLLSLLLSGQAEVRDSQEEFAKTTGLGQRTIAPALLELESEGLITIIAQPGKPSIVRLIQAEGVRHETTITEVGPDRIGTAEKGALAPPGTGVGVAGSLAGAGGVQGVALRPEGGLVGETTVTEIDPYVVTSTDRPLLRGGAAGSGEETGRRVGENGNEQATGNSGGSGGVDAHGGGLLGGDEVQAGGQDHTISESVEHLALPIRQAAYEVPATAPMDSEEALIAACRMVDERKDGELRVAALQDVWDFAFPFEEYPTQRLTNEGARRLLSYTNQVNRSAEWVGQVILSAVRNARGKISNPRAYIETALFNEERRGKGETRQEGGISDELRRLAQLGREQFAKNKDSPGYIE